MFKEIIFVLICLVIAWIVIFQILAPFIQGTPFFPAFRSNKLSEVEKEIAAAREDLTVSAMRSELNTLKPPAQDNTEESK